MKPINLKISAFGPYKDVENINFETLGENGIFLITGDTGAGKTTIFDAISFALFGEVSGSNRTVQSLRSNFADLDVDTFVEFEFSHKNHTYKIKRNPMYVRNKKRGEGTTTTPPDGYIELDSGIVITGYNAVTEKVEEILGINERQFKQIAMLAQGEFVKILFAESKERTEIFRRIFDTNIFNKITRKLENLQKDEKYKLADLQSSFATLASGIVLEDEAFELAQAKNINELYINEVLEKLENEISKNEEKYNKIIEDVKQAEKKEKSLEEDLKNKTEQNANLDELNKLQKLREEFKIKSKDIENKETLLNKSNEILSKVLPKEEKVLDAKKEIAKIEVELKALEKEIENGKTFEIKNQEITNNLETIKQDLQKYNELQNANLEIEKNLNKSRQIILIQQAKEKLVNNYNLVEDEFKKLNAEYIEKEDEFFREQAGILAEKLEENKPCPVCGSLAHPCIAKKSKTVLTKAVLEKLKQNLEQKEKNRQKIKLDIAEQKSKIDTLLQELDIKEDLIEYGKNLKLLFNQNEENMKILLDNINNLYNKITGKNIDIKTFDFDLFKNEELEKLTKEKEEVAKAVTLKNEKEKQKINFTKKFEEYKFEYIKSYEALGFVTEEEYKIKVLSEDKLKLVQKEIEQYKLDVNINENKILELSKKTAGLEKIDLEQGKILLKEAKENLVSARNKQLKYTVVVEKNKNALKELLQTAKKLQATIKKFNTLDELYKTASGNLNHKKKIEFEQYVQATYFDMVIIEANKRLLKMTDNRFRLVRKENSLKISDRLGLDLEVIDYYNGKQRDVKSLSGGEAFKAALSLALGLSDIIQNYSGGVVIETLFIDEGFGSLDTESREQAINTLNQLSNNNKLIGIISHVTELKERIDKKIIITKSQVGSKVKIEV